MAKKLWALAGALLILMMVLAFTACAGAMDIDATGVSFITSHDAGLGYDMCITCHGIGTAELEFPLDTAHIGRTDDSCLTPSCHVVVK
jgi:hypothetical protein